MMRQIAPEGRCRKGTEKTLAVSEAVPEIDVGDYVRLVLYAKHKKESKLDYTWLGPCVVTKVVTPLVYRIRPYTLYESQSFDVHIQRLRRFAGKKLHMTEQLKLDVAADFEDNVVAKIVGHEYKHGTLPVHGM